MTSRTPPSRRAPSRLPVRGAIGLGVTTAGLAMLLAVRPAGTNGGALAFLPDPTDETTGSMGAVAPSTAPGTSAPVAPSSSVAASASPAPSASAAATAIASPTTAPTATAAPSATLVGDAVSTRFGTVQVQVTVENGVITAVEALQLPSDDRRSQSISQEVEPMLAEMALVAQSASIDTISGATYTTRAYRQSLQSALDQLAA